MPLDQSKLRAYLAAAPPRAGRKSLPVASPPPPARPFLKRGESVEVLRALLERGEALDDAAIGRLLSQRVGYMELRSDVVGFACGSCGYSDVDGNCRNPAVLAPVSQTAGCCNLFWPEDESEVVFPPPAKR